MSNPQLSFYAVFVAPVLALIFVWPNPNSSLEANKQYLLVAIAGLAAIFWLIHCLATKGLSSSKSPRAIGIFLDILAAVFSGLFSASPHYSFFGDGGEVTTIISLSALFIFFFLAADFFQKRDRPAFFYLLIFSSFLFIFTFQTIALIFSQSSFWSLWPNRLVNLIGRWQDLPIFFGLIVLLATGFLDLLSENLSRRWKTFLIINLSLALIGLLVFQSTRVWLAVGGFAFLLLVYTAISNHSRSGLVIKRWSTPVIFLAILFLPLGQNGQNLLTKPLVRLDQIIGLPVVVEPQPSWSGVELVARSIWSRAGWFGVGSNQFSSEWLKVKTNEANRGEWWSLEPKAGFGLVPTLAITTGLFGVLAWLVFYAGLFWQAGQTVRRLGTKKGQAPLVVISLLATLYLWLFAMIDVLGLALFTLTFVISGIYLAISTSTTPEIRLEKRFNRGSTAHLLFLFLTLVLLLGVLVISYLNVQQFVARQNFLSSLNALNQTPSDLSLAENKINAAIRFDEKDLYYRQATEIAIRQLDNLLNEKTENQGLTADDRRRAAQTIINRAIGSAEAAVRRRPENYLNQFVLGQVYEHLATLGTTGARERALAAYTEAEKLNPQSPAITYQLARLAIVGQDNVQTRKYLKQALQKKEDYLPALNLLTQLEIEAENFQAAVVLAETISILKPDNFSDWFTLGYLRYRNHDLEGAIAALTKTLILNPDYANARYFLGLSYGELGQTSLAIEQLELVSRLNPDRLDLQEILTNLRQGRKPI